MSDYSELKAKAKAATQGVWQVIESKLPCRIGRPHVERRIFTAKDHPQLKAPYPVINGSVALGTDETPVHHMVSMTAADAAYIAAANPATILALIADNELLNAENKQLILLECNGGTAQAAVNLLTDRDQLRAEVAGLKTGYEAYERVNAELKAECEALRKDLRNWQEVVDAVKREAADRVTHTSHGNAPGHCHSISGVWDGDNGALAGKECAWCKTWNAAMGKGDRP